MASRVHARNELSAADAVGMILRAQGLDPSATPAGGVAGMLEQVASVQLDTISVLARSHELVMYSRLGPIGRDAVETAYWQTSNPTTFEYWAHCACILPIGVWPYFEFRRDEHRRKNRIKELPPKVVAEVRARLADGPITITDVGGARSAPGGWWDRSEAKRTLESMWWTGGVVCSRRESWKRVYDLPERAVSPALRDRTPTSEECHEYLVKSAVRAMGVATRHDIANYYQLRLRDVDRALADAGGLAPVSVSGWDDQAWTATEQLTTPSAYTVASRTTLLSPFDSLIWERKRMRRLFGVVVMLEAYVPQAKRVNGYFAMPVLSGGRLIGHVDPARKGRTLGIKQLTLFDEDALPQMAAALREAASWVGATSVVIERALPKAVGRKLQRTLS